MIAQASSHGGLNPPASAAGLLNPEGGGFRASDFPVSTGWFLIPIAGVLLWGVKIAYPCLRVRLEFKPQDCWIGAYWEARGCPCEDPFCQCCEQHLWVCLLPMLPIHLNWPRGH